MSDGQGSLFGASPAYPEAAGWKRTETSRDAAQATDAPTLRRLVHEFLRQEGPHTADEVAIAAGLSVLAVRPRCSELRRLGLVVDSGARGVNASGKLAIVWRAV